MSRRENTGRKRKMMEQQKGGRDGGRRPKGDDGFSGRRKKQPDRPEEEDIRRKKSSSRESGAAGIRQGNRQIVLVAYCTVFLFLGMIGYLVQFMVRDSQKVINNPSNKRQELLAEKIVRGDILSREGKVLATTRSEKNGKETRVYPYHRVFCHVVGRTSNSMTGIELDQSFPLLTSHVNPLKQLANEFRGEKNQGDNVITTLDAGLQQAAYDAMSGYKGAAVAIEPSTGKILAMVSKPDYDPGTVPENWENLVEDSGSESALLNRATQGLYPPGSTFKVLTAMEYIRENHAFRKYRYTCDGSDVFGGNIIRCYDGERHGTVDLKDSLAHSCNGSFANIGVGLNRQSFKKLCIKFGFNKSFQLEFEYNKSKFSLNKKSDKAEVAQTSIGQGKTMITPLLNAMINAAIANDGVMMKPYLADRLESADGRVVKQYEPEVLNKAVSKKLAKRVTGMMKAVVTDGTAVSLKYLPYPVAGKTGTAEYDSDGNSHAWFVGFAPADDPKIAVSIVAEGAGTGSRHAVPVAQRMFEEYLDR